MLDAEKMRYKLLSEQRRLQGIHEYLRTQHSLDNADLTLMDLTVQHLTAVRWALRRLDEGTYGTCATCGAQIAEERLEVSPTAGLCLPCARNQEAHPRRQQAPYKADRPPHRTPSIAG